MPLTTADFCHRARAVHAARLAVVDEPGVPGGLGELTYGELLARCDGMVSALDELGVAPGERVAIVSPNAAKLLIALYATTGSGRILVPVNFRLTAAEAQYIVDDAGVSLLLVDPELDERFASVTAPRRIVLDGEQDAALFAPAAAPREWPAVAEEAPATINYTSGTTAAPKGVVLSHRSHWLNAATVGWGFGLTEGDRYLHTLPTFHVNGWGLPLACAALGVPQAIQREVRGPEILRRVAAHGITLLCGAAPVAATIEQAAAALRDAGAAVPGDGVARMVSGGAPTPAAIIEQFERTTGWEMIQAYGLTETAPVLTTNRILRSEGLSPSERARRLAAAGAPLVGVQLRADEHGEILARTAKTMDGYWNKPELYRQAVRADGWFHTGDGGTLEDGVLRITDRKKDVIVTGGENVSSLEVEAVLYQHPDVVDAAIIGVPHERWGETPKAVVVLRDGVSLDEQQLIDHCREHLAGFKCPTLFEQRRELPRTATGKVQKFLLRETGAR
ncbi:AMP-binding protein [Conexibacter stalactiti]|uniref:AMP-binding protein n=1 Tax=Conexibacter stalactiti TaxID=1940611 RepID=A0ABU4HYR6_9ACTN|nr:AMP-binding protein [Conexibacter stalactiti]MDW5597620.1 AMP-binding protein [Conexibacter stalactiti]MEC5038262.1 AMP-binding protein [Conexibacter stalactiti]